MFRFLFIMSAVFIISAPLRAGGFFGSHGRTTVCLSERCQEGECPCNPWIVVHPTGYTGMGGEIEVRVCVDPATSGIVAPAVAEAIEIWNSLTATTGNCVDCLTVEEPTPSIGVGSMASVVLHELGHCAMGLGHSNFLGTNFTDTRDSSSIDDGADNIRGSRDDRPAPLPGSRLLHWYRVSDNNPVVVDSTVIDRDTFSRSIAALPPGSTWPANGNRFVADLLGAGDHTQSVMHTVAAPNLRYTGLTADEVNTVRYAMTGLDSQAGTADDYTIRLIQTWDCATADVEVVFAPLDSPDTVGSCLMLLNPIDPVKPAIGYTHHAAVPASSLGLPRIQVSVDSDGPVIWDVVSADGFETGNVSTWSEQVP